MTNGEIDTTSGATVQMSLIYSRLRQINSKNMFAKLHFIRFIPSFFIN